MFHLFFIFINFATSNYTHVKPNCLEHLNYVLILARSLEIYRDEILTCNLIIVGNLF